MKTPTTGNIIVDKTIGAKEISRSGNQVLDRSLNQNADGVQRTGNNILDRAIHGGNTLLSVNSKKGSALVNDRPNNLASKKSIQARKIRWDGGRVLKNRAMRAATRTIQTANRLTTDPAVCIRAESQLIFRRSRVTYRGVLRPLL